MPLHNITLTRKQSRHIDEVATELLKIPSLILMENAGRSAAEWIYGQYKVTFDAGDTAAQIICGTGNNGGDGLVIARHLHNAGCDVKVWIVGDRARLTHDALANLNIVLAMEMPIIDLIDENDVDRACSSFSREDVIVDSMLGTGFFGEVREPMATFIDRINAANCERVVAIDVPSGLDCDLGTVGNVGIRATSTVTFVAMKTGFELPFASEYVGEVFVGTIGTPPSLIREVLSDESTKEPSGES